MDKINEVSRTSDKTLQTVTILEQSLITTKEELAKSTSRINELGSRLDYLDKAQKGVIIDLIVENDKLNYAPLSNKLQELKTQLFESIERNISNGIEIVSNRERLQRVETDTRESMQVWQKTTRALALVEPQVMHLLQHKVSATDAFSQLQVQVSKNTNTCISIHNSSITFGEHLATALTRMDALEEVVQNILNEQETENSQASSEEEASVALVNSATSSPPTVASIYSNNSAIQQSNPLYHSNVQHQSSLHQSALNSTVQSQPNGRPQVNRDPDPSQFSYVAALLLNLAPPTNRSNLLSTENESSANEYFHRMLNPDAAWLVSQDLTKKQASTHAEWMARQSPSLKSEDIDHPIIVMTFMIDVGKLFIMAAQYGIDTRAIQVSTFLDARLKKQCERSVRYPMPPPTALGASTLAMSSLSHRVPGMNPLIPHLDNLTITTRDILQFLWYSMNKDPVQLHSCFLLSFQRPSLDIITAKKSISDYISNFTEDIYILIGLSEVISFGNIFKPELKLNLLPDMNTILACLISQIAYDEPMFDILQNPDVQQVLTISSRAPTYSQNDLMQFVAVVSQVVTSFIARHEEASKTSEIPLSPGRVVRNVVNNRLTPAPISRKDAPGIKFLKNYYTFRDELWKLNALFSERTEYRAINMLMRFLKPRASRLFIKIDNEHVNSAATTANKTNSQSNSRNQINSTMPSKKSTSQFQPRGRELTQFPRNQSSEQRSKTYSSNQRNNSYPSSQRTNTYPSSQRDSNYSPNHRDRSQSPNDARSNHIQLPTTPRSPVQPLGPDHSSRYFGNNQPDPNKVPPRPTTPPNASAFNSNGPKNSAESTSKFPTTKYRESSSPKSDSSRQFKPSVPRPNLKQEMAKNYSKTKSINAIVPEQVEHQEWEENLQSPDPMYHYPDVLAEPNFEEEIQEYNRSESPEIEDYPTLNWDSYNQNDEDEHYYSDDDNIPFQCCLINLTDEAKLLIDANLDETIADNKIPGLPHSTRSYSTDRTGMLPSHRMITRSHDTIRVTDGTLPVTMLSLQAEKITTVEDVVKCRGIIDNTLECYNMINPIVLNAFSVPILVCKEAEIICELPFSDDYWKSCHSVVLFIKLHHDLESVPIKFYLVPELNMLPCIIGDLSVIAEIMQVSYNSTCNPLAPYWARRPQKIFDFHIIVRMYHDFIHCTATIDMGSTACRIHPDLIDKRIALQFAKRSLELQDESVFINAAGQTEPIESFVCLPISLMTCMQPDLPNGRFKMSEYYTVVFLIDSSIPNPRQMVLNYETAIYTGAITPRKEDSIELRFVDSRSPNLHDPSILQQAAFTKPDILMRNRFTEPYENSRYTDICDFTKYHFKKKEQSRPTAAEIEYDCETDDVPQRADLPRPMHRLGRWPKPHQSALLLTKPIRSLTPIVQKSPQVDLISTGTLNEYYIYADIVRKRFVNSHRIVIDSDGEADFPAEMRFSEVYKPRTIHIGASDAVLHNEFSAALPYCYFKVFPEVCNYSDFNVISKRIFNEFFTGNIEDVVTESMPYKFLFLESDRQAPKYRTVAYYSHTTVSCMLVSRDTAQRHMRSPSIMVGPIVIHILEQNDNVQVPLVLSRKVGEFLSVCQMSQQLHPTVATSLQSTMITPSCQDWLQLRRNLVPQVSIDHCRLPLSVVTNYPRQRTRTGYSLPSHIFDRFNLMNSDLLLASDFIVREQIGNHFYTLLIHHVIILDDEILICSRFNSQLRTLFNHRQLLDIMRKFPPSALIILQQSGTLSNFGTCSRQNWIAFINAIAEIVLAPNSRPTFEEHLELHIDPATGPFDMACCTFATNHRAASQFIPDIEDQYGIHQFYNEIIKGEFLYWNAIGGPIRTQTANVLDIHIHQHIVQIIIHWEFNPDYHCMRHSISLDHIISMIRSIDFMLVQATCPRQNMQHYFPGYVNHPLSSPITMPQPYAPHDAVNQAGRNQRNVITSLNQRIPLLFYPSRPDVQPVTGYRGVVTIYRHTPFDLLCFGAGLPFNPRCFNPLIVEQTLLHPIPLFSGPNPNLHDQVEDAVMEQSIQDDEFGYPILNPPKKRSHQETKLSTGLTIQQMAANFVLNRSKWDLLHVPGIENNFYFQSLQLNCPKTDSEEDNSSDIPSLIADSDSDDDDEDLDMLPSHDNGIQQPDSNSYQNSTDPSFSSLTPPSNEDEQEENYTPLLPIFPILAVAPISSDISKTMVSKFPLAISTTEDLPRNFRTQVFLDSCSGLSAITEKFLEDFSKEFTIPETAFKQINVSFQVANNQVCHSNRQVTLALLITPNSDKPDYELQSFVIVKSLPAPVLISCYDSCRTGLLHLWMGQYVPTKKVVSRHGSATIVSSTLKRDHTNPLSLVPLNPPSMEPGND